ncbi:LPS translocon maturation chaperone LptM [Azonexus hydrophilus]|nr:lipoprotein [Azonexus hydrophilus]
MSRIAAVLIILSLAACGMKGPLELPPQAGKPASAGAGDVSTAQRSNTQ